MSILSIYRHTITLSYNDRWGIRSVVEGSRELALVVARLRELSDFILRVVLLI